METASNCRMPRSIAARRVHPLFHQGVVALHVIAELFPDKILDRLVVSMSWVKAPHAMKSQVSGWHSMASKCEKLCKSFATLIESIIIHHFSKLFNFQSH